MLGGGRPRVVAGDDVIREAGEQGRIILRAHVLERAESHMAGRRARQHGARQRLPIMLARGAGGHDGERPGGGHTERMHRLAHQELAEHRPDDGEAVDPRHRRRADSLQVHVAQASAAVASLAEERGAAVAEDRLEDTPLVARVHLRDRGGTLPGTTRR